MAEWNGGEGRRQGRKEQTPHGDTLQEADGISRETLQMIAWKLRSRAPVRLAESLGCDKEEIAKFRAFGRILETKEKVDLFFSLLLSWRDRQPGNHVDRLCTVLKKIGSGHLMKELREHEASVQASNQPGHMSADEKLKNEAGAPQEQTTLDATTPEVELSQRTLSKIAQRLHYASLQGLAENLGLSGENIDFCKSDVLKTDSAKIVFMLFYWKEVHRLNQVESLGEALEKIGRRDLAIELHGISQKDQHFPITLEKTLENQTDTSDEQASNDAAAETLGSEETSDQSGQLTTSRSVGSIEEELTDNTLYTISQNFDPRKLTGLAAKLGLENVTVLQLQADFPNNVVEQTYRLLIDWKQRQPAGVNKSQALYDALASETIGMRNLAALLQGTKGLISDRRVSDAGETCAAALEDYYKDSCSHVSLLPWVHDDMKHITDIHTRPRLTLGAKGATRLKETSLAAESFNGTILESYEEIFLEKTKEDNHVLVAVINGLHGTGKTTLFHKMAYDWACGKALKRFKLLVLLKMSALEQSSDLIEAMFGQLLDEETSIQKDALKEYVRNPGNVSKVLVLLDGFDEFMTTNLERSSFGSVLKILKRKVFRGCTVLVSTRPSHFNKLLTHELVREPFTHVRILGFSDDDVVEYVNKFFRPEEKGFLGLDGRKSNKPIQVAGGAAQAEGILNKIRSSGVLFHLARTPMLLLFMCLLWREEKTLPETLSGLFGDAMYFIFNAKGVPEEEMSDIVIGIGEAGLKHGFLSQNQDTFVKKSDFKQPNMLDKALEVGILTKQKVLQRLRTQNIIQFIHPTFQEFSAAKYLQSLLKVDIKTFRTTLYEVISRDAVGFEYLLRFCCGDNQDCTVEVLKQFVEIFLDDLSLYSTLGQLALHCYFEGRSKFLPPKEFTDAFITTDIVFDGRDWDDSDLFISLAYFLKRVAEHDKEHGTRHLAKIQKLVLINCKLTNFDEDLAFAMTAMTNLRSVELESCSLTGKAVALVTRSLKSAANLAELDFASNGHLGGTATTWNIYFKQLSHIQKLDLSGCSLRGDGAVHVLEALSELSLVELNLANNDLGGAADRWSKHLKQLEKLKKLDLCNCSLKARDMRDILESLQDLTEFLELNISRNSYLSGISCFVQASLRSRTRQKEVDPGFDQEGPAPWWCMYLTKLQRMEILDMSDSVLTDLDVKNVCHALSDLPNFVEWNLSSNSLLGGHADKFAIHLQLLQHIRKLHLKKCFLKGQDINSIVESLSCLPSLIELNLSRNGLGDSPVWCQQLKMLTNLKKLSLKGCSLEGEHVRQTAESLRYLPNLIALNLSSNDLRDTAASWAVYLKGLIHLQTLKLKFCNLLQKDMRCIKETLERNGLAIEYY